MLKRKWSKWHQGFLELPSAIVLAIAATAAQAENPGNFDPGGRSSGMAASIVASDPASGSGGVVEGGPIEALDGPHISEAEYAEASELISRFKRTHGPLVQQQAAGVPEKLPFYPMAGNLWRDLWTNNFADLDPTAGILDWDCTNFAYDGHDASDTDLRSFGEQEIGVPVFAALDGMVLAAMDGHFDMNTTGCPPNSPANYVILGHAGGRNTYYWHLKKDSVAVSVGDTVKAGQQIAMVASSGCSTTPHLHFAVYDDEGATMVEPYAGPCRPGESEWINQTPIERSTYLRDFGVTYEPSSSFPGRPYEFPRSGQIALSDPNVNYWFLLQNRPANSTWRTRFQRPNGTIAFDSGTRSFNTAAARSVYFWHSWNITDMHSITGTWYILFDVNGVRMVDAPVEVRTERTADFNRAPEPISVSFDPVNPRESDVIACRVQTDRVLDDLDYDIVRYHYVWTVDGAVVRDVVTAAQSDVIPHHTAMSGKDLTCTVTPSDGKEDGPTAFVSSVLPAAVCADNLREGAEECDGTDDDACPALCQADCTCLCLLASAAVSALPDAGNGSATRHLAIQAGDAGVNEAIRVTFTDLEPPYDVWNGVQMWVQEPTDYCEKASEDTPPCSGATWKGATLDCTPYYTDWSTLGTVYVFNEGIIPKSSYTIQVIDETCAANDPSSYSTALVMDTSRMGDCCGNPASNPPNGAAGLPDVIAVLQKFANDPSAPIKARLDHAKVGSVENVDHLISLPDVIAPLQGFANLPYPGTPSVGDPCPGAVMFKVGGPLAPTSAGAPVEAVIPVHRERIASLRLVPDQTVVAPGRLVTVDVFVDHVDDMQGYQLALDVSGGVSGAIAVEDLWIDPDRPDYAFPSGDALDAVDLDGRRLLAV